MSCLGQSNGSHPLNDTEVSLRYLQFFFNLSLILLFLYLLVQFILTVQRDVEHRISEYSMGELYRSPDRRDHTKRCFPV